MKNNITKSVWGNIDVNGLGSGKDWKLHPNGGREWDWNETGTHHNPGIQITDIIELVDNGAIEIILSSGHHMMLQLPIETSKWLDDKNIKFDYLRTDQAVDSYNKKLDLGIKVGGLFHSTC